MKNICIVMIIVSFASIDCVYSKDVNITIPKLTFENTINALITSRALSFGADVNSVSYVNYANIRFKELIDFEFINDNDAEITFKFDTYGEFLSGTPFRFSKNLSDKQIKVYVEVQMNYVGNDYFKVVLNPYDFDYLSSDWFKDLLNAASFIIIDYLPEISFTTKMELLNTVANEYFESNVPVITTSDNEMILSFTAKRDNVFLGGMEKTVVLTEDKIVESGKTLTILPGTILELESDIVVEAGGTLDVKSGVLIYMSDSKKIESDGSVKMIGSESNPIVFKGLSGPSDQGGIQLIGNNNYLNFVTIVDLSLTILPGTELNLYGDLIIEDGAGLEIKEGVTINFMEKDIKIVSNGSLSILGTVSDRVTINGYTFGTNPGNEIIANRGATIRRADIYRVPVSVNQTYGTDQADIQYSKFQLNITWFREL